MLTLSKDFEAKTLFYGEPMQTDDGFDKLRVSRAVEKACCSVPCS